MNLGDGAALGLMGQDPEHRADPHSMHLPAAAIVVTVIQVVLISVQYRTIVIPSIHAGSSAMLKKIYLIIRRVSSLMFNISLFKLGSRAVFYAARFCGGARSSWRALRCACSCSRFHRMAPMRWMFLVTIASAT